MDISPKEIDSIEDIGSLGGNVVKMLKTKGGFWMAVGKDPVHSVEKILGAGSHPAIVKFNLEKQYPNFQTILQKSQNTLFHPIVNEHAGSLSSEMRQEGYNIYSIHSGPSIEFHVTKHNIKVGKAKGLLVEDSLVLQKMEISKEISPCLARAVSVKALSCGARSISIQRE